MIFADEWKRFSVLSLMPWHSLVGKLSYFSFWVCLNLFNLLFFKSEKNNHLINFSIIFVNRFLNHFYIEMKKIKNAFLHSCNLVIGTVEKFFWLWLVLPSFFFHFQKMCKKISCFSLYNRQGAGRADWRARPSIFVLSI